jgi:hypothetical protein
MAQTTGSPFDSEHSAGLARADANRTKPLSSTVKGVREALATLPAATSRPGSPRAARWTP